MPYLSTGLYREVVDWVPVVTTVLGAIIGVGSTLLVDRFRSGQERDRQWEEMKRESYVQFLVAAHHTQQALCMVTEGASEISKAIHARDAFRVNGIYAACEQVMIVAPDNVRVVANEVFELLREFRDRVDEYDHDVPEHKVALDGYKQRRDFLRDLMHNDLRYATRRRPIASV